MKTLTLGNGFIASHLPYPIITDRISPYRQQITNLLDTYAPDVLVNCLGYAGTKNIDSCAQNKQKTLDSNLLIPTLLATECAARNIRLIHISSGCIFYEQSPSEGFTEDSPTIPLSFYSKSKLACDLAIQNFPQTSILRIRMPISHKESPRNLITKLKNYKKIISIPNSVTFLDDLTRCIDHFVQNDLPGIYNATNPDPLTHAELMSEYQKHDSDYKFTLFTEQEMNQIITEPRSNCILNTKKINNAGFHFTPTKEILQTTLTKYFENR